MVTAVEKAESIATSAVQCKLDNLRLTEKAENVEGSSSADRLELLSSIRLGVAELASLGEMQVFDPKSSAAHALATSLLVLDSPKAVAFSVGSSMPMPTGQMAGLAHSAML